MMMKISLRSLFALVFACGLLFFMGHTVQADTYVTVTGSTVNIRSSPEINDYNRITQVPRGTTVRIVDTAGDFFRAYLPDIGYAYISREWVAFYQTRGTVTAPAAWIFDTPDDYLGTPVYIAVENDVFTVVSYYGNWYGIIHDGQLAFIEKQFMQTPGLIDIPPMRTSIEAEEYYNSNCLRESVVARARGRLGSSYRWGSTGPNSFDCSGLMIFVFSHYGINLPRRSRDMATAGTHVARSDVRSGDLVFFATGGGRNVSHVGMYVGGGQFIHSSSSRGVVLDNFHSAYWTRVFVTARRVI